MNKEEENLNNAENPKLGISDVIGSYTVSCKKCKSMEDTFTKNEKSEDYGWFLHRNKWYCPPCSHNFR
jgi:hypothetical protein